jgi:para-aminobenzoate synthetase/4-amino-4-deoxychorismate lyase
VVIEEGGTKITPPVTCGLLAGTYRAELLERGDIIERTISLDRLRAAERLWLVNSVHEWRAAALRS